MNDVVLRHDSVGLATSFRQQAFLLLRSGRWAGLLVHDVVLLFLVLRMPDWTANDAGFATLLLALMAAPVWALGIWYGELPQRRLHWSLPVSRAAHDLARVAAGAVFLMGSWVLLAVLLVLALGPSLTTIGADEVATFFAGPLVLYFVTMPLVLWSHSRVPAAAGLIVSAVALASVADVPGVQSIVLPLFEGQWGLEAALYGGFLRSVGMDGGAPLAAALWLALGLAATLVTATWRPAELVRPAKPG